MQLCSEGAPAGALISCEQAAYSCTILPAPPQARFPWERADVQRTRETFCPWCVKAGFLRGYVEAHGHSRAHTMWGQRGSSSGALRARREAPGSRTVNQWLRLGKMGKSTAEPQQKRHTNLLALAAPAPHVLFTNSLRPHGSQTARSPAGAQNWPTWKWLVKSHSLSPCVEFCATMGKKLSSCWTQTYTLSSPRTINERARMESLLIRAARIPAITITRKK